MTRSRLAPPAPSGGIAAAAVAAGAEAAGGPPALAPRPPRPWATAVDGSPIPVSRCDICFMSLEELRTEAGWGRASPLARVGVWRLAVDEAELIASAASVAAMAASSVYRRAAWMLTGTPVGRAVADVEGLFDYLNLGSLCHPATARTLALSKPATPIRGLATLFHVFALHRSRADARLAVPPPAVVDTIVSHSRVETAAYRAVLARARTTLASSRRGALTGGPRCAKHAAALRLALVRLRQAACHPRAALAALGATARVAPSAGVGDQRATMDEIMDALVVRAVAREVAARRAAETAALLGAGLRASDGDRAARAALYACLARVGQEALALASDDGAAPEALVRRRAADGSLVEGSWPGTSAGGHALAASVAALAASAGGGGGARGRGAAGARAVRAVTTDADTRAAVDAAADAAAAAADAGPSDRARLDAAAAWASLYLDGLDVAAAVLEKDGGDSHTLATAADALRTALGLDDPSALVAASTPRFSRRARGMQVDEELGAAAVAQLAADHAAQRQAFVLRAFDKLRARDGGDSRRRGGADEAAARADRAQAAAGDAWHSLKHALAQRAAFVREKQPAVDAGAVATADDANAPPLDGDDDGFDPDTACPICFDALSAPSVTPCGHAFCTGCISAALDAAAAAPGAQPACPVCRVPLSAGDIVTAVAPGDTDAAAADAPASLAASEFGAKLAALVDLLTSEPTCKAVVFSSWGRLLKLGGAALA